MQPARQPTNPPQPPTKEGPFRADQIREGDPYELSNGHPVLCMSAGARHGGANLIGAAVLATDPAVQGAGVDVGHEFNEGKNLRAPDVSIGIDAEKPGWSKTLPPLAVEYADRGQDEKELQRKIGELLEAGTLHVWVVRLVGPLRVEVYEPGKEKRVVDADGELTAPGLLKNSYKVRDLLDRSVGSRAMLRNLLQQEGYEGLDDIRAKEQAQGQRHAVLDLCEVFNIEVTATRQAQLDRLDLPGLEQLRADLKRLRSWPS
jgi:hypothetical protein